MLDSPQLRGNVLSTINGVQYDQRRYLTIWDLESRELAVFFQFYLTKGLIYEGYVSVESEALFWLLQNVLHNFNGGHYVNDKGPGVVISMWLMSIVPSCEHIYFRFDSIGVEGQLTLSRYDNVERVGFSSRIFRQMGWDGMKMNKSSLEN